MTVYNQSNYNKIRYMTEKEKPQEFVEQVNKNNLFESNNNFSSNIAFTRLLIELFNVRNMESEYIYVLSCIPDAKLTELVELKNEFTKNKIRFRE